ncbi:MAG: hypothetical protein Q9203_000947, partial [Teloschistes exilis]
CGALSQGLGIQEEAGYYNPSHKPVKSFLAEGNTRPEALERADDGLRLADGSIPHALDLDKDVVGKSTSQYSIIENGQSQTEDEIQLPLCNRCHRLLHHNTGQSIAHPSLHSIHQTIDESPHGHNHVYHVLDAADFPLSLIPQLQRRLDLTPQRSQNRRAKTRVFRRGRQADMSFIVTRSDLLAPQKAQVDKLMPYLVQVLRAALGSVGQGVRLGNVHCVSAKRGWWTSQIKDEIRERGGGVWLVGKVNVGKSNLFECIFPKMGAEDCSRIPPTAIRTPNLPSHGPHGKSARHPGPHAAGKSQFFDPQRAMGDVLLPPPQPEKRFPTMPTVSHVPGTTASPIRIPFGGGKGEVIDLPGLARGSLEEYVLSQHRSDLVMRQRIKPVQYVIKPGQSLLISGLVRITPSTPGITVLAYPFVPLTAHVTSTEKAIAINTQTHSSGVPTIAKPGIGQKMALAGSFQLQWDVTKQRAGPLTSSSAAGLSVNALPFVVLAVDILIEGCGWVELTAQVRLKNMDYTGEGSKFPMLYNIRLGQGAAILPKDIKRIHLDFASKISDGHFGARKVWRNYLPRLKYHNPAVSMTVNRSQDQAGPATLTIFYASPHDSSTSSPSSAAPSSSTTSITSTSDHTPFERAETISMKHRHESQILSDLLNLTKATPIVASPEEEAELQALADERKRSEADRARNAAYTEQKRQEKALLDQARGAIGAA